MQTPAKWMIPLVIIIVFLMLWWPLRILRWHTPEYYCLDGRHRMQVEQTRIVWAWSIEVWSLPMVWDCNDWYRTDKKGAVKNGPAGGIPDTSSFTSPTGPADQY